MCGICGKVDLSGKPISYQLLERMCRSFSYRGPDDQGIEVLQGVALGHRRLSIIDLSAAGRQPMCNEDGTIWLVYNGEIYGFQAIRKRLMEEGHRLSSRTDGEVIIHLYEEQGPDCLKELSGMFAFGLWDASRRRLWLARDRLGIKPLCYAWNGGRLVFGSEMKAVLCDPEVRREMDPEALDLYLTLSYVPAPWTIYRGVRKLEPGTGLILEGGSLSLDRYWDLPKGPTGPDSARLSVETAREGLFRRLDSAVERRLIADVPLGAFLSGGVDSSIVVGLMARHMERPVRTFSIGYRDLPAFDETSYAREVAEFHGTDHHEFRLEAADVLEAFPAVLENLDEPFADSSAIPTFIVSRETGGHVKVALSGDGGDELFAGYRMYRGERWARPYNVIPALIRERMILPVLEKLPERRNARGLELLRRAKKFARGANPDFAERFCGWREIFSRDERRALLGSPGVGGLYLERIREQVRQEADRFPGDAVNLMLYLDAKGLLPNDMLAKVDRMSMANSLEVRVPMLDHDVVEYAFGLPGDLKLKGRTGKYILMETFRELLPPSLHRRPKMGFEMPIGAWLRGELRFLVDEYLSPGVIEKQGVFSREAVDDLVRRHLGGFQDTSWKLWTLIVFGHWHRTFMGG